MNEINEAPTEPPNKAPTGAPIGAPNETHGRKRKERPLIQNTAGQLEQEMKSRRYNLIELIIAQGFLNVIFWAIWYPAELANNDLGKTISYGLLGLLGIVVLFTAPFRHKDTLKGLGFGDPRHVIDKIRHGRTPSKIFFIFILCLLVAIGIGAFWFLWTTLAEDLFSMNEIEALAFQSSPLGIIAIPILGVVIALFLGLFVIRYDNFLNALKMAFIIILILGTPLMLLAVYLQPNVLSTVNWGDFALGVAGYLFWGALQQVLFASYFGTRFRKAFSPAIEVAVPGKPTREEEKKMYGKRFVVSILAGSFFGLIHIPSWTLTGFTIVLGVAISWLYMKDGNRNLIAIGLMHGFLGSIAGTFFSGETVEMSVGPGNVPPEMGPWMWLVYIGIAALLIGIVLIWNAYEKGSRKK